MMQCNCLRHAWQLREFRWFFRGISAIGTAAGMRICGHRIRRNRARGGTMDMPLWYWQLCIGVLVIALLFAFEID